MKIKNRLGVCLLLILCLFLGIQAVQEIRREAGWWRGRFYHAVANQCVNLFCPYIDYADSGWHRADLTEQIRMAIWREIPLCLFLEEQESQMAYAQSQPVYDAGSILGEPDVEQQELRDSVQAENEEALRQGREENAAIQTQEKTQETGELQITAQEGFAPAHKKAVSYLREQLANPQFIKEQFFTEDATTWIDPQRLDVNRLLGFDATLKQDSSAPQILIYHTHSQEAYADSTPGDASTTIMGVGEYLSAILEKQYGYHVLHHLGQYDVESRDYAYSKAAAGLEEVLAQNPTIEVIIDLHRDEMREDVRLVTQLQGRTTARFMFFNGLSYTRERGEITSLPNQYIQENLAFAFQMKLAAEEYYPGLTRKSYLKGYRYNLQYRPKSLLIELGAQTNTVEEAMNACPPLAHILDMVLKGEINIDNP